jgi:hypothetical protein
MRCWMTMQDQTIQMMMTNCSQCHKEFLPPTWRHKLCGSVCKRARRAYQYRTWYVSNTAKARASGNLHRKLNARRIDLWRKYKITPETYDTMYAAQNGCCGICLKPFDLLHVDHDHTSKMVRGLLCFRCNNSLERLESVAGWAEAATKYLRAYAV